MRVIFRVWSWRTSSAALDPAAGAEACVLCGLVRSAAPLAPAIEGRRRQEGVGGGSKCVKVWGGVSGVELLVIEGCRCSLLVVSGVAMFTLQSSQAQHESHKHSSSHEHRHGQRQPAK